jgi:hypothetical protein
MINFSLELDFEVVVYSRGKWGGINDVFTDSK